MAEKAKIPEGLSLNRIFDMGPASENVQSNFGNFGDPLLVRTATPNLAMMTIG